MKFATLFVLSAFAPLAVSARGTYHGETPSDFKAKAGLKKDYKLKLHKIKQDNSFSFLDGTKIFLNALEPHTVLSPSATCFDGLNEAKCPETTVFAGTQNGRKIVAAKNANGDIEFVKVKKGPNNYMFQAIKPNVLAYIPDEAQDPAFFGSFKMKDIDLGNRIRRQLRGAVSDHSGPVSRQLQGPCSSFREVELAVAVESSFCSQIGNANVDAKVQSLIADVSTDYEQPGLCFKVTMVHYEKHCNAATDPYKAGVDLNSSGCDGSGGLLGYFQDYWNRNRRNVNRDLAQLFSGTGLECDSEGCVIGCANLSAACTSTGYGVNYVTYTTNAAAQSQLISHEMGHNLGADHDDGSTNFIMYPSDTGNNNGIFSQQTINSFLEPNANTCITSTSGPPTTTSTTAATSTTTSTSATTSSTTTTTTTTSAEEDYYYYDDNYYY